MQALEMLESLVIPESSDCDVRNKEKVSRRENSIGNHFRRMLLA